MRMDYLLVFSEADPVARALRDCILPGEPTGDHLDGAAIRRYGSRAGTVRRPGLHIHDEHFDRHLPTEYRDVTLVFPSIHRSEQGIECLSVHPLGNPGVSAEVGGASRTLVPTDPRLMTGALRALAPRAQEAGVAATFEATHHGPALSQPAFFVEIGFGERPGPPPAWVGILADVLPDLVRESEDRVALAVGGGHYAPHFTDLVLKRRWALGHILSRHVLSDISAETARSAWEQTPGRTGVLFARAEDSRLPIWKALGPRLRDGGAQRRPDSSTTRGGVPAAGTE